MAYIGLGLGALDILLGIIYLIFFGALVGFSLLSGGSSN